MNNNLFFNIIIIIIYKHFYSKTFIVNTRINGKSALNIRKLLSLKKKERGSVTKIANRLGSPGIGPHEWLTLTPKDKMPKPDVVSFPKPPKAPDGSLMYERIPNKIIELESKDFTVISPAPPSSVPTTFRKRNIEETHLNGTEGKLIIVLIRLITI